METRTPITELLELDEDLLATLVEVHSQRWNRTDHLLADLIQVVDRSNRLLEVVAGYKKSERSKPLVVPRPKTKTDKAKRRTATVADLQLLAHKWGGAMEGVSHA